MPRSCGPCGDERRNELDRRLLKMEISGESFRKISQEFGYSEYALRRHKENHLTLDLAEVRQAKEEAKREALDEIKAKAREAAGEDIKEGTAARLENASNFLDQLKEVRHKAANLLDRAEKAGDLKASGVFLRELREQIRLWAELEGKLAAQPQVNILVNPEWIELRALIIKALDSYPEAKEAVVNAIRRG